MTLKDKLGALEEGESGLGTQEVEAMEALQSLGYTLAEARSALKKISPELADTGDKVKAALKLLGKH